MKAKERVFNNVTEQRRKTMSKIRGKNTTIAVSYTHLMLMKTVNIRDMMYTSRTESVKISV